VPTASDQTTIFSHGHYVGPVSMLPPNFSNDVPP
jgi:hypothetical protein